ncbi:hypothetical protein [Pseudomonas putida]|uniref:Uncharacterized protein n=1 Tax=Pseudomonas putida TaxID=303 RepID=A0A8I1EBF8_PSEPU|nr:hypothetical protein [Pseudomonas putida]MBI6882586.1 hypothetical protein [Pseudomonas putida]
MTTSIYVQNAQRITDAIFKAFRNGDLDPIPQLSAEYQQAMAELIQADGVWGLHTDLSISLDHVAERLISLKTKDGYPLVGDGMRSAPHFVSAFIQYLPLSIQTAQRLVRIQECDLGKLVDKLKKSHFTYHLSSTNGLITLVDDIAAGSQRSADSFIVDILSKSVFGRPGDVISAIALLKTASMIDKPSAALTEIVGKKEAEFEGCFAGDDAAKKIGEMQSVVKLSIRALTGLKRAGWSSMLERLINTGVIDHKKGSAREFFEEGIELPKPFVAKALGSKRDQFDLKLALYEALTSSRNSVFYALSFMDGEKGNELGDFWLKCLGDTITTAKKDGLSLDEDRIVQLIEDFSVKIPNQKILKGGALASGIDGEYLARTPSLRQYRGDFVHQELGL